MDQWTTRHRLAYSPPPPEQSGGRVNWRADDADRADPVNHCKQALQSCWPTASWPRGRATAILLAPPILRPNHQHETRTQDMRAGHRTTVEGTECGVTLSSGTAKKVDFGNGGFIG